MAYIGNSPEQQTILRLEQRKSFALSLWFMDSNRRPADLTGCTVRLVVKTPPFADDPADGTNLITHDVAEFPDPTQGFARFELQASELNLAGGEYPFVIVLLSDGYSSVVVKGYIAVEVNPEFSSMTDVYDDVQAPMALDVIMRSGASIDVICGAVVPPGFTWMSDADKAKVDGLSLAGNLLPSGGLVNQMMAKASGDDYDFKWVNPQAFDGTLDASGQPAGYAPVSNGDGSWDWASVSTVVDWDLPEGEPNSIINKPTLGTAAAQDSTAFAAATHTHELTDLTNTAAEVLDAAWLPRVIDLRGISRGTADPTGGEDGDLYLKVLP